MKRLQHLWILTLLVAPTGCVTEPARPSPEIPVSEEIVRLEVDEVAPVSATLPAEGEIAPGTLVPVTLEAHLTELGTLELWCKAREGEGRWRLEFDVRER